MGQRYLIEENAWYDQSQIDAWQENFPMAEFGYMRFDWRRYKSNWRILHIDGFEPGYGSRTISFRCSQRAVLGGFSDKTAQEKVAEL